MFLTLKQISDKTGIGVSLLRFYRDRYEEYLQFTGDGRTRKYAENSIDIFLLIAKGYREKFDYEQIKQELDNKCGFIIPNLTQSKTETTEQEDLVQSLRLMLAEELNRRDELILELQEELESIKQTLLKQDERNEDRARSAEDRDRDILQRINEIRTEQQQRNKPWWRRLSRT